jgi:antitoxin VapB
MKKAKLFKNGQSQAIRLPKEFRFEGDEVYIKKLGSAVLILPQKRQAWDNLLNSLEEFSDDFLSARNQPSLQKREDL